LQTLHLRPPSELLLIGCMDSRADFVVARLEHAQPLVEVVSAPEHCCQMHTC
jgi:hypothetical protein